MRLYSTGEIDDLVSLIDKIRDFQPREYKSNNYKFNKLIRDYIDSI